MSASLESNPTAAASTPASSSSNANLSPRDAMMAKTNWAVLGDVLNPNKPASRIVKRLVFSHKKAVLINPRFTGDSGSERVYTSLKDAIASNKIEVLDLVINNVEGLQQLQAVPENTPLSVWIQPGAVSPQILELCKKRQWPIFEGCVLVEFVSKL